MAFSIVRLMISRWISDLIQGFGKGVSNEREREWKNVRAKAAKRMK